MQTKKRTVWERKESEGSEESPEVDFSDSEWKEVNSRKVWENKQAIINPESNIRQAYKTRATSRMEPEQFSTTEWGEEIVKEDFGDREVIDISMITTVESEETNSATKKPLSDKEIKEMCRRAGIPWRPKYWAKKRKEESLVWLGDDGKMTLEEGKEHDRRVLDGFSEYVERRTKEMKEGEALSTSSKERLGNRTELEEKGMERCVEYDGLIASEIEKFKTYLHIYPRDTEEERREGNMEEMLVMRKWG